MSNDARRTAAALGADPEPFGATLAHHGEGPVWDAAGERLLWLDITGRAIHATALDGVTTTVGLPDAVGAVVPAADGGLLAAVGTGFVRVELPTGGIEPLADTPPADLPVRMNDGAADPRGRFWAGTMGREAEPGAGALYRLDGRGAAPAVRTGLSVPNGPVWSPDGRTMYFTDTPTERVRAYAYDPDTGELGADRTIVDARGLGGQPDGMTVDAEGALWIAFWDGGAVRRFAPDGELLAELRLPVTRPTRPAFGGPDGDVLFVTTSRFDLSPAELADQPLAGRLFACVPGVAGTVPPPAAPLG
ncbi:SMP-30/gluconolactonase/LRE family protein [Patulibacter sp. S7RM1-6]